MNDDAMNTYAYTRTMYHTAHILFISSVMFDVSIHQYIAMGMNILHEIHPHSYTRYSPSMVWVYCECVQPFVRWRHERISRFRARSFQYILSLLLSLLSYWLVMLQNQIIMVKLRRSDSMCSLWSFRALTPCKCFVRWARNVYPLLSARKLRNKYGYIIHTWATLFFCQVLYHQIVNSHAVLWPFSSTHVALTSPFKTMTCCYSLGEFSFPHIFLPKNANEVRRVIIIFEPGLTFNYAPSLLPCPAKMSFACISNVTKVYIEKFSLLALQKFNINAMKSTLNFSLEEGIGLWWTLFRVHFNFWFEEIWFMHILEDHKIRFCLERRKS